MIEKTLTMLKADTGYVLKKGDIYTASVLLREDETSEGWEEITQAEYDAIIAEQEAAQKAEEEAMAADLEAEVEG